MIEFALLLVCVRPVLVEEVTVGEEVDGGGAGGDVVPVVEGGGVVVAGGYGSVVGSVLRLHSDVVL